MVVQHNISAMNTNRQLGIIVGDQKKSTEKLSSGYRVNRAGDDAAGLSISEKMRNQIRGLNQASKNAEDGISLIQTAEGALGEIHAILQRMGELSTQAANDTNVSDDRAAIQKEIDALAAEITRIACQTEFNTMKLLNGTFSGKMLQVGANKGQTISISISSMNAAAIGVASLNVKSHSTAAKAIQAVTSAIKQVSEQRSALGALQNRLEHTIAYVDNAAENLQATEARIRDTNMASEMVNYSKNNILQQAAQAMLAQANQQTQGVLSLIR